jgi:hypothetical protein
MSISRTHIIMIEITEMLSCIRNLLGKFYHLGSMRGGVDRVLNRYPFLQLWAGTSNRAWGCSSRLGVSSFGRGEW